MTATLKQKVKRGSHLDARTARMFRFDPDREVWQLVDLTGWNAKSKYVWGRVDRPGI